MIYSTSSNRFSKAVKAAEQGVNLLRDIFRRVKEERAREEPRETQLIGFNEAQEGQIHDVEKSVSDVLKVIRKFSGDHANAVDCIFPIETFRSILRDIKDISVISEADELKLGSFLNDLDSPGAVEILIRQVRGYESKRCKKYKGLKAYITDFVVNYAEGEKVEECVFGEERKNALSILLVLTMFFLVDRARPHMKKSFADFLASHDFLQMSHELVEKEDTPSTRERRHKNEVTVWKAFYAKKMFEVVAPNNCKGCTDLLFAAFSCLAGWGTHCFMRSKSNKCKAKKCCDWFMQRQIYDSDIDGPLPIEHPPSEFHVEQPPVNAPQVNTPAAELDKGKQDVMELQDENFDPLQFDNDPTLELFFDKNSTLPEHLA